MPISPRFGALLIVHAEDSRAIDRAPPPRRRPLRDVPRLAAARRGEPAIAEVIERAAPPGARTHIVHLSASDALPMIAAARATGCRSPSRPARTTSPSPPRRSPTARRRSSAARRSARPPTASCCGQGSPTARSTASSSDHSPCTAGAQGLEIGDFVVAWGGIVVAAARAVAWSGPRPPRAGIDAGDVVRWMARAPRRARRAAAQGRDRASATTPTSASSRRTTTSSSTRPRLQHRNPVTPYAGRPLAGVVRSTCLRGRRVDRDGEPGRRLLRRGEA